MKRMWKRHRTWFLAALAGLSTATALFVWFTPRPERIIELPEVTGTDTRYWFADVGETAAPWVPIFQMQNPYLGVDRLHLVQPATGVIREWTPRDKANIPQLFHPRGKLLAHADMLTASAYSWSRWRRNVEWFDPETGRSGMIGLPVFDGTPEAPRHVNGRLTADGSAFVRARCLQDRWIEIQVFDLVKESVSKTTRLARQLNFEKHGYIHFAISANAEEIALPHNDKFNGPMDIFSMTTGEFVQTLNGGYDVFTLRDAKVNTTKSAGDTLISVNASGEQLWQSEQRYRIASRNGELLRLCPDKPETTPQPTYCIPVPPSSTPAFVSGSSGLVSVSEFGDSRTDAERSINSLASSLGIPFEFEYKRGYVAYWYNWSTDEVRMFRRMSSDTEIDATFAVRGDQICLLINPSGPNPKVEVWPGPPPRRQVLGTWLFSLLVAYATWFWLKRRQRTDTITSATEAAALG